MTGGLFCRATRHVTHVSKADGRPRLTSYQCRQIRFTSHLSIQHICKGAGERFPRVGKLRRRPSPKITEDAKRTPTRERARRTPLYNIGQIA
jgi:hypothetical protein